jgi:hypothetical protein
MVPIYVPQTLIVPIYVPQTLIVCLIVCHLQCLLNTVVKIVEGIKWKVCKASSTVVAVIVIAITNKETIEWSERASGLSSGG